MHHMNTGGEHERSNTRLNPRAACNVRSRRLEKHKDVPKVDLDLLRMRIPICGKTKTSHLLTFWTSRGRTEDKSCKIFVHIKPQVRISNQRLQGSAHRRCQKMFTRVISGFLETQDRNRILGYGNATYLGPRLLPKTPYDDPVNKKRQNKFNEMNKSTENPEVLRVAQ